MPVVGRKCLTSTPLAELGPAAADPRPSGRPVRSSHDSIPAPGAEPADRWPRGSGIPHRRSRRTTEKGGRDAQQGLVITTTRHSLCTRIPRLPGHTSAPRRVRPKDGAPPDVLSARLSSRHVQSWVAPVGSGRRSTCTSCAGSPIEQSSAQRRTDPWALPDVLVTARHQKGAPCARQALVLTPPSRSEGASLSEHRVRDTGTSAGTMLAPGRTPCER